MRLTSSWPCLAALAALAALAGCATRPPAPAPATPWAQRLAVLQQAASWGLEGRTAVAIGTQGWQASLLWQQLGDDSQVHLSGPLGVGALLLELTPQGLALNGAPPGDATLGQVQARLGFEPPLANLRFWLLGVPDPHAAFDLTRNAADRAQHLVQSEWHIEYQRYAPVGSDALPDRLVLERGDVRVRVVVDRWTWPGKQSVPGGKAP
jgi:outer membrane lipoprotein LolB